MEYSAEVSPKRNITIIVIVIVSVVAFFVLMVAGIIGLVFSVLESQKDSEEYKLAYDYLVTSEAFEMLGAEEGEIRFNSYSGSSSNGERSAALGFLVEGKSFEVVCHRQNGVWVVCEECTLFE